MPSLTDTQKLIERRHPDWQENALRWQWLLDSYEGGEVYRKATYGTDTFGMPLYNLRRHKREAPLSRYAQSPYTVDATGQDPSARAGEDDFQLRRAGTPIPDFVREAADIHTATLYESEVKREGPDNLVAFWDSIDGKGCSIDQWMADEIAPLILVLGQLDVVVDHPMVPDGETVRTLADEQRLNLNAAIASYILPQNMLWWIRDEDGCYLECLVREPIDGDPECNYRHWTTTESTLYDCKGNVLKTVPHRFGRPPIVRVFNRRSPRSCNVGKSQYEVNADLQRAYYNRDSELILSDTVQAFPLLQAPEDYCTGDSSIPIGPGYILPKKKNNSGSTPVYESWEVVDFPKGAADSIRQNLANIRDASDRAACLTKPAGASGTTGSTVAQSGISKRLDSTNGNKLLAKIAASMQNVERQIAELALLVLNNGKVTPADVDAIQISYPGSFDLFSADELATAIEQFQNMLSASGQCPEAETKAFQRYYREWLQGLEPEEYDEIDEEIEMFVESKSAMKQQQAEAGIDPLTGMPLVPPSPNTTSDNTEGPQGSTTPGEPTDTAEE